MGFDGEVTLFNAGVFSPVIGVVLEFPVAPSVTSHIVAPMGRIRRRLFQRQPDRFRDGVISNVSRHAGAGLIIQTIEALLRIPTEASLARMRCSRAGTAR